MFVYELGGCWFEPRCSHLTNLYSELLFLKQIVLRNVYPENFVRKFSKKLRIKYIHLVKETTLTVGKKPILWSFRTLVQYPHRIGLSWQNYSKNH